MTCSVLLRSSRYAVAGAADADALGWVTAVGAGDADAVGAELAPEPAPGAAQAAITTARASPTACADLWIRTLTTPSFPNHRTRSPSIVRMTFPVFRSVSTYRVDSTTSSNE